MTEPANDDTPTGPGAPKQRWLEDIQEALERTGDAIRTAWDATRDSRMSALESARQAAQELGVALDKGISAARERWAGAEPGEPASPETPPGEDAPPKPDEA